MQITCPNCQARYLVRDADIGPEGRTVRCSKCKHSWRASLPVMPLVEPAPAPAPETPAEETPAVYNENIEGLGEFAVAPPKTGLPAIPKSPMLLWLRISAAALGVLLLVAAPLAYREILSTKPVASTVLRIVGASSSSGLVLSSVEAKKLPSLKKDKYLVTGEIVNETEMDRHVVNRRVTLKDTDGNILQTMMDNDNTILLKPGESVPFQIRLEGKFEKQKALIIEIGSALDLALRK